MPRLVVLGIVLLALASAVLAWLVPRWVELPGAVLADPGFATLGTEVRTSVWQKLGSGRIEPVPGGVRLVNDDPDAVVGLDQSITIPPGVDAFRVTATVTLEDVVAGPERWQRPRVVVRGVAADGRVHTGGHLQLIDRVGDVGPVRLSAVFLVTSPLDEARLMLRLVRTTGVMEIRDLEVTAALRPPARDLLRRGLIVLWLGIGAVLGGVLWWQSQDRLAASLVLGGLGLVALIALLPHSVRQPLYELLDALGGDGHFQTLKPLLHVVGFAVLAAASRLAQPQRPLWQLVAGWLAAAVLVELAELLVHQFDAGDLVDMVLNATGVGLGLAAAGLFLRRRRDRTTIADPASWSPFSRRP